MAWQGWQVGLATEAAEHDVNSGAGEVGIRGRWLAGGRCVVARVRGRRCRGHCQCQGGFGVAVDLAVPLTSLMLPLPPGPPLPTW